MLPESVGAVLMIGHFIVSESIFTGLKKTIIKFRKIINN